MISVLGDRSTLPDAIIDLMNLWDQRNRKTKILYCYGESFVLKLCYSSGLVCDCIVQMEILTELTLGC